MSSKEGKMSTFGERESLEERYALPKFKEWLKQRGWTYKRFRYATPLTDIDINSLPLSEEERIKVKSALKMIDFKHDGIMCRSIGLKDVWFFDLKYKNISRWNPQAKVIL